MFSKAKPRGTLRVQGETKLTVSRGASHWVFCYTSQLKISANKFVAKFPEQRGKVCFAKFMEAFVQILLFAEVSQRSHGIVGRLVSRFGAFIASKLLNFFFSSCLKPFSCHDCVKIICLTRLANKFAAVSKVYDLITCESKVQVVVALGRHEVLTNDTWQVLQSGNVYELGGITLTFVSRASTKNSPQITRKVYPTVEREVFYIHEVHTRKSCI